MLGGVRDVYERAKIYEVDPVRILRDEEGFQKAVAQLRKEFVVTQNPEELYLKTLKKPVMLLKTVRGKGWEAQLVYVPTAGIKRGIKGAIISVGDHKICLPGVWEEDLNGLSLKTANPDKVLLSIVEYTGYPINAPMVIDSELVSMRAEYDSIVLTAGDFETKIPVSKLELKEFKILSYVDNSNRHIHQVPYMLIHSGVHKFPIALDTRRLNIHGLFVAIRDGEVSVDVERKATFKSKQKIYGEEYQTTGGTVVKMATENSMRKETVSYLDISAVWRGDDVRGVIVNSYYRRVVPRKLIEDGLSGITISENGVRVRRFSVSLKHYEQL